MSCPRCGHIQPFPHHFSVDTNRSTLPELAHYECNKCGLKFWMKYKGNINKKITEG